MGTLLWILFKVCCSLDLSQREPRLSQEERFKDDYSDHSIVDPSFGWCSRFAILPRGTNLTWKDDRTDHCVESHVSSLSNRNRRQLPLGQGSRVNGILSFHFPILCYLMKGVCCFSLLLTVARGFTGILAGDLVKKQKW